MSSGVSSSGDLSSPCDCGENEPGAAGTAVAASMESHLSGELESHYVSQDVLEKIRECGSTVTYYGGRVLDKRTEHISTMTRAIMREIRGQDRQCGVCQPHGCLRHTVDDDEEEVGDVDEEDERDEHGGHAHGCPGSLRRPMSGEREGGLGVKFKLVKSNSCSSRLELAGTGKTPPDLLRPNGRMRGRHILPEESSTRCTAEATIEEPEESVRDMVSRLESGNATLTTRTTNKPRIIESRCIEKYEPEPAITINNQTTVEGAQVASDRKSPTAEPVTVNNHINVVHPVVTANASVPQPPPIPGPLVIPPLLRGGPAKTLPVSEVITTTVAPTTGATSMERPPKVCRNKNVDLAFAATMKQLVGLNGNGTVRQSSAVKKSPSQSSVTTEANTHDPDSAPSSAASVTKTVTFNFTNGASTETTATNGNEESHHTNGAATHTVDHSENLRPSAIAEQRKADELTSPKLVNWSSIGRFDERQYFANDRKLIEKRKYDDMEFEEFEVLDPNAPPSSEHYDSLNSK
uniref:Uncharacterized protein n=1 Tax=Anopheles culicifacies TaxID=139723 RepID=A0A182MTF4_9DIPT